MTEMKDHKLVECRVSPEELTGPVTDESPDVFKLSVGGVPLSNAEVQWLFWDHEFLVSGWRPMTEKELAARDRKRESAKRAAAKRKLEWEERERAEYERLKRKFER